MFIGAHCGGTPPATPPSPNFCQSSHYSKFVPHMHPNNLDDAVQTNRQLNETLCRILLDDASVLGKICNTRNLFSMFQHAAHFRIWCSMCSSSRCSRCSRYGSGQQLSINGDNCLQRKSAWMRHWDRVGDVSQTFGNKLHKLEDALTCWLMLTVTDWCWLKSTNAKLEKLKQSF